MQTYWRFAAFYLPQASLLLKDCTTGSIQLAKLLVVHLVLKEGTEVAIQIICPLTDS